ncbi:hypothetical protein DL96DRAFT_518576 [Flagelloscypha sp. PMI_526]|nr:hypothetical protein DL96DRAFT_518576 [Flagelloscypha sp. PMI_526]
MYWYQLPFELILIILTLAARTDKATRLSLTCVSKELQEISDPYIFQDILVGKSRKTTQMLKKMFSRSCSSPRLIRARNYIASFRSLSKRDFEGNLLENALRYCTNLRLLVYRDIRQSSTYRVEPPSTLCTIGISQIYRPEYVASNIQSTALFRWVTHLVIEHINNHDLLPLLHASNLTHVYLGCTSYSISPWKGGAASFPPRLRLCLVYLAFFQPSMSISQYYDLIADSPLSDIQNGLTDDRFVPVIIRGYLEWPGSKSSRGFLVGPECHFEAQYPGQYALFSNDFTDRKVIYDWVDAAWADGEEIVNQRQTGRLVEAEHLTLTSS